MPAGQLSQAGWPVAFWKVPGLHGVGFAAPVEQLCPTGQRTQSSARVITVRFAFWKRPEGQGSAALAPSAQKEPAVHNSHAVEPGCSWKVPAAQKMQLPCMVRLLNVPALQGVSCALPTGQNVPSLHVTQSAMLVMTLETFLVVPPGQGSGAAAPSVQ